MDKQHNATREEVNALEVRMDKQHNATREDINALEARMDKRLEKMDTKFDRLNWLLITTLIGVIASLALQII
ncbi:hypothetical protein JCM19233_4906 [Vibrio astriarenae]|nr:hypothetical protein JCM19233_4906 [Vibrio sp. C7]